jgi:hypothetical protein
MYVPNILAVADNYMEWKSNCEKLFVEDINNIRTTILLPHLDKFKYYMLGPVCVIDNNSIKAKSHKFHDYDDINNFLQNLSEEIYPYVITTVHYKDVETNEHKASYIFRFGKKE